MSFDIEAIRKFAVDWYVALDRHVPLRDVLPMLVDEGLEMRFPETTAYGHTGFTEWYDAVTHRFFDERHEVTKVDATVKDDEAMVTVLVNWQAKVWDPPAATSTWLGFDADQTWVVVPGEDGSGLRIRTYIVNALTPMPGSAEL
ncbi:nuclear transport factor 2 family protein [Actinomadura fibrosa]|uniref:Nuclear transport factor 2 family protein n=1 Tax=Actinomadura fibrosa TaxID=111802 RepID=A0ABW2XT95_9ACTN|nr:nuclear transport factor 2 family protein [Actinomadura fibrosa]